VVGWVYGRLAEQGKELLFAKTLRNRATACEVIIHAAAKKAAMGGAIPVPGADLAAVTAVQLKLISNIAAIYDKKLDKDMVSFVLAELLAGSSKGFVRWSINALKTAGWVPGGQVAHVATSALGAAIAGATTYGVGRATVALMHRDLRMERTEIKEVFNAAAFAYKQGELRELPGPDER
jgi:GTP-binding protein Era